MTLALTFVTLAVAFMLMPDVFGDLWRGAVANPVFGVGLLAVLVLVSVWTDRNSRG